jgi:hypothetical protein
MSVIVLLDTSIYLNILNIPGYNQKNITVLDEFELRMNNGDYFFLPLASIWETGNHIADIVDGGNRRRFASKLFEDVRKAINGSAPYRPTYFPSRDDFLIWLEQFPDYAARNKAENHTREGVSLSDLSIIKEWEKACNCFSMSRVLIWSLDRDLIGYDRAP